MKSALKHVGAAALSACLVACDAVTGAFDTVKESIAQAQALSQDIEKVAGARPGVSINWKNGELAEVRLSFESMPKDVRVAELAEHARAAIRKRLTKEPQQLLLAFSMAAR